MGEFEKQRVRNIHNMILEMASGNFHYQIERSSKDDDLESIIVGLNMLAEEIEANMVHQGFANANTTIMDIIKMSFILDENGVVEMVNGQAGKMLSLPVDNIVGKLFEDFLTDDSKTLWKNKWISKTRKPKLEGSVHLVFKRKNNFEVPKVVHFTTFKDRANESRKLLITVVQHSYYQKKLKSELKKKVINGKYQRVLNDTSLLSKKNKMVLTYGDIQKIRAAHNIIFNNPQTDFPSQKDFALQLGTNEFKLKYGFKELYGTTIHKFIIQERLRKAQVMIQYTDLPFKTIANKVGFKSQSHFSRLFKQRFGYTPKELRKNTISRGKL
ncbi:AraC family transcriptional regulator [Gelidibacter japonicus]|uniref:AraC family transcriptional regulator n=1 Tax=Gelidibacter japonicus TaxID=1962232 RepID=UPI0013D17805|nr:helix-turn-helix domain-containing protein [Gelidibacter japonicus]